MASLNKLIKSKDGCQLWTIVILFLTLVILSKFILYYYILEYYYIVLSFFFLYIYSRMRNLDLRPIHTNTTTGTVVYSILRVHIGYTSVCSV